MESQPEQPRILHTLELVEKMRAHALTHSDSKDLLTDAAARLEDLFQQVQL